jgi:hypothetical protein
MKRSDLYDKVWSMPVIKVGDEVGLTSTRMAAICKQHGIPTPPRGYWSKLSVGKQPPRTPLPQPEADYEIRVGVPSRRPKPSSWVVPGVLLRLDTNIAQPQHPATPHEKPEPPKVLPQPLRSVPQPDEPKPKPIPLHIDMELLRAAASELQGIQAIRELLQAVSTRAMHAPPDEVERVLNWAAAVRARLDEHDPISALLRLALEPR